jgi:hypothetical protein
MPFRIDTQVRIRQELSELKAVGGRYQQIIVSLRDEHRYPELMDALVWALGTRYAECREGLSLALGELGDKMRSSILSSGENTIPRQCGSSIIRAWAGEGKSNGMSCPTLQYRGYFPSLSPMRALSRRKIVETLLES